MSERPSFDFVKSKGKRLIVRRQWQNHRGLVQASIIINMKYENQV